MATMAVEDETSTARIRAFEVICSFPDGISESELKVNCRGQNDRQQSSSDNESNIDAIWKYRTSTNSSLFNGTKFRFKNVQVHNASSPPMLNLGVTDYKSFLGTNCAPNWQQLDPSNMASPLGNAAIVETEDERVVLLKRSGNVGEAPHTVVMPGGHPEPEMVGIRTIDDWKKKERNADSEDDGFNDDICGELWDSMVREVVEETGIPREALGEALCIGFTRRVQNYRPDIIFFIKCTLSSDEVHRLYAEGPEHKSESTDLITMDRVEFMKQVIKTDSINMPGCHRGGVELYCRFFAQGRE